MSTTDDTESISSSCDFDNEYYYPREYYPRYQEKEYFFTLNEFLKTHELSPIRYFGELRNIPSYQLEDKTETYQLIKMLYDVLIQYFRTEHVSDDHDSEDMDYLYLLSMRIGILKHPEFMKEYRVLKELLGIFIRKHEAHYISSERVNTDLFKQEEKLLAFELYLSKLIKIV